MKRIFTAILLIVVAAQMPCASAQNKADRKTAKELQAAIIYLASDELEGRRTGTEGERKAADYIEAQYKKNEIPPYKGQYCYPFHFVYGKEIAPATQMRIGDKLIPPDDKAFPLPFSANKQAYSEILPDVMELGNIWMIALYNDSEEAKDPHFDAEKYMYDHSKEAEGQGATGVLFYDPYNSRFEPVFNKQSQYEPLDIPIAFLGYATYQKYVLQNGNYETYIREHNGGLPIGLNVAVAKAERTGINVAACINNNAKYTAVIGAHYDHLGRGEDGNSLYTGNDKQIHHGADDNASGTAALLEIAQWIKKHGLTNYNYLFINFSGEELGLLGSKAFIKDNGLDSSHIAYMINMDMVGRLNDSTQALTLGGVGTSPVWSEIIAMGSDFKLVIDSSGVGPSDHTSFYNNGIPVLFFFTGIHSDYHKPSDVANKINYKGEVMVIRYAEKILAKMDDENQKPRFTATKQNSYENVNFKVTLGIMPDYSYQEGGVRVDGVSENRPAMKAGIKQGDVIVKLGEYKIQGLQSYMEALGKFFPGDKTNVTVLRSGKETVLPIELNK